MELCGKKVKPRANLWSFVGKMWTLKNGLKIRFPLKECRFESDHRYQHLALIFRAIFLLIPPLSHPCPTLRKSAPVQAWPVAQGSGD